MLTHFADIADALMNIYIAPGMMISMGLCFFFVTFSQCQALECYKRSRWLMGVTFVVYGLALMLEQMANKGADTFGPTARLIIIYISISQAFLFTSTLVTLVDISYFTKRRIGGEGLVLLAIMIVAFYVAHRWKQLSYAMLYASVAFYMLLLIRYVLIFRRRYATYQNCMDNYFSDDESKRLLWVNHSFYYSLGVGVFALVYSFFLSHLTSFVFISVVMLYYSYFAIRFINYPFTFSVYKEAIEEVVAECDDEEPSPILLFPSLDKVKSRMDEAPSEDDYKLMSEIEKVILSERLYKIPNLTVSMLEVKLQTKHRNLSGAIMRCHGMNFKSYINKLRIDEAARLLSEGWLQERTIDLLAEECGFGSRISFYRVFKRIKGVAPTNYGAN